MGNIGLQALSGFVLDKRLQQIPLLLELPATCKRPTRGRGSYDCKILATSMIKRQHTNLRIRCATGKTQLEDPRYVAFCLDTLC